MEKRPSDECEASPPAKVAKTEEAVSVAEPDTPKGDAPKKDKAPKQRMAVLFGYRGTGYKGSQFNGETETIEKALLDAFVKSGAITAENNDPKKIGLNRCARTDKGVHAAGNVVSAKLLAIDDIVAKINACLPDQIQIYDAFQTVSSFNAKNHCGGRQYEYSLPTYVLKPSTRYLYQYSNLPEESVEMVQEEAYSEVVKFRLEKESLEELRSCLKLYEGTHNFHNFTVGCKFKEKNAGRYMTSFVAGEPYVRDDGVEWIKLRVCGQSFMLHQIRKMVGLAVMMTRTKTPAALVTLAYKEQKINIPKVPALGLMLRKPTFDAFNEQQKTKFENRKSVELDNYTNLVDSFVEQYITPDMYQEESDQHVFLNWIRHVDSHAADFAWWLTKEGDVLVDLKPVDVKEDADEDAVPGQKFNQED
ncbi:tRNA pseudouridine synthase 1 [Podochytrium sp. JEL0797]|nr:tRNA pseudouridine synthase 1 [Podochytrium sp. JEL0797]